MPVSSYVGKQYQLTDGGKMIQMTNELQGRGSIIKRERSHVCKAGHYKTNKVVKMGALLCHGGYDQPPCRYLKECAKENGLKLRRKK